MRASGEKGMISVGLGYSPTTEKAIVKESGGFTLNELPLSKEGVITLILLMQIASYHLIFRKKIGDPTRSEPS